MEVEIPSFDGPCTAQADAWAMLLAHVNAQQLVRADACLDVLETGLHHAARREEACGANFSDFDLPKRQSWR